MRANESYMRRKENTSICGTVFNIQRFSVHDGPGIRTTAFLKGCPLHCRWCHNPEGILDKPELLYTEDRCTGCGACIPACPENAISLQGKKARISESCTHCGACVDVCPELALEISGRVMTAEAVANELARDRIFYEESGGGITLSGGEPLAQPEFATEILRRCKELKLHTTLDTTGFVEAESLEAARPFVDLFLFDLKHPDSAIHEEGTDVPNELIIENLQTLCAKGCDVLVRQPIIPGYNDAPEIIEKTGALLERCGVKRLEIFSYHTLGKSKRDKLIRDIPGFITGVLTGIQILELKNMLDPFQFDTIIEA